MQLANNCNRFHHTEHRKYDITPAISSQIRVSKPSANLANSNEMLLSSGYTHSRARARANEHQTVSIFRKTVLIRCAHTHWLMPKYEYVLLVASCEHTQSTDYPNSEAEPDSVGSGSSDVLSLSHSIGFIERIEWTFLIHMFDKRRRVLIEWKFTGTNWTIELNLQISQQEGLRMRARQNSIDWNTNKAYILLFDKMLRHTTISRDKNGQSHIHIDSHRATFHW